MIYMNFALSVKAVALMIEASTLKGVKLFVYLPAIVKYNCLLTEND